MTPIGEKEFTAIWEKASVTPQAQRKHAKRGNPRRRTKTPLDTLETARREAIASIKASQAMLAMINQMIADIKPDESETRHGRRHTQGTVAV